MSGPLHPESSTGRPPMAAEQVAGRGFMVVRRGYDPDEVRAFLAQVAAELRSLHAQIDALEQRAALPAPSAAAPAPSAAPATLPTDDDALVELVGEETTAVLRAARAAAAELRRKAEVEAERVVDEAQVAAAALREEAESSHAAATAETEREVAALLEAARAEAEAVVERARAEGDAMREQAEQQRRLTIEGAQAMREKILADLSRRRRVATVQIEQLRAGRERLLESYGVVRRTLEEVHDELQRADAEARTAADEAGRRAADAEGPADGDGDEVVPPIGEAPDAAGADEVPEAELLEPQVLEPQVLEPQVLEPQVPVPSAAEPETPVDVAPAPPPATAAGPAPAPAGPAEGDEDAAAAGEGIERVRILRRGSAPGTSRPRQEGRSGPPALRAVAGGRMAAGGAAEVRIVPAGGAEDAPAGEAPTAAPAAPAPAGPPGADDAGQRREAAGPGRGDVDELFARLRSGRRASVAAARDVLGATPGATDAHGAGEGEDGGDGGADAARSDADEAALQQRDAAVVDVEAALTKRLKRALQDDQNELLDRLRGARGALRAATLLPDHQAHQARLAAACRAQLDAVVAAGAAHGGGPAPDGLGAERADALAATLVTPLRRRIGEVVAERGGDEQAAVVEALGAVYREWKTQRVEPAAFDAVVTAFASGASAAMAPGTPVRWVVEDRDGPCADCDDNALAGYLPLGEAFPTGQVHPPAHAGCRCLLVPEP